MSIFTIQYTIYFTVIHTQNLFYTMKQNRKKHREAEKDY